MAIEFPCRYCQAIIRVPDSAKGGKGRCPKCAMRITVPSKSQPLHTEAPQQVELFKQEDEPVTLQAAEDEPDTDGPIVFAEAPPELTHSEQQFPPPSETVTDRLGKLPVETPPRARAITRRPEKKKKPNPLAKGIGFTLLAVALIAAGIYAFSLSMSTKITGRVSAQTAESLDLPPVVIRKSHFKLPSEFVDEALSQLEQNPVPLNSQMMQIRLKGSTEGLAVSLDAGEQARFYRVELDELPTLKKYLSHQLLNLEEKRFSQITTSATAFLETYSKVIAKETSAQSITVFRDSMAIPALVQGLGFELVAQHARTLYRCVYQDREGGYYFLLPPGVTDFKIVGQTHADGQAPVPLEIEVHVDGSISPLPSLQKPDTENSPPTDSDEKKAPSEKLTSE